MDNVAEHFKKAMANASQTGEDPGKVNTDLKLVSSPHKLTISRDNRTLLCTFTFERQQGPGTQFGAQGNRVFEVYKLATT